MDQHDNPIIARTEADYARHEEDLQWEAWAEAVRADLEDEEV